MDRPNCIQDTVELAFKKFLEQTWKNVWSLLVGCSTMPDLKNTPPAKRANETKVSRMAATEGAAGASNNEDWLRVRRVG
jgi:hypothetical protein